VSLLTVLVLLAFAPAASARSGDLAWQRIYDGSAGGEDIYIAAAAAPRCVYAAGKTTATTLDFLVAR